MEILVIRNYDTKLNWQYKGFKNKEITELEQIAKKINRNAKLKKTAIFVLGSLLYCSTALAKGADTAKINSGGMKILSLTRDIGYWIAIILASFEIIKNLMQGDTKSTGKSIMKYSLGYGSLYLLPWIFDLIKSIFS